MHVHLWLPTKYALHEVPKHLLAGGLEKIINKQFWKSNRVKSTLHFSNYACFYQLHELMSCSHLLWILVIGQIKFYNLNDLWMSIEFSLMRIN